MDSIFLSKKVRIDVLEMINKANAQHIGPAFSIVDILTVLYSGILKFDPSNPKAKARDIFILSKGHAGAAIYATLAECGFFPVSWLEHYEENGGLLSGHVSSHGVPGVELSTGALGHGLSVGCGIAYGFKCDKKKNRVFVLIGDGENEEGSVWEAATFASRFHLDNLTVIVDRNRFQAMGKVDDIMACDSGLEKKWADFGFDTQTVNGHDHVALEAAFSKRVPGKPHAIIADTIKGKGVSFMENDLKWHYTSPKGEEYEKAKLELEEALNK
jgi:transketolase